MTTTPRLVPDRPSDAVWNVGCDAPRNGGRLYIGAATIDGHFVRLRIEDDFADAVKRHAFMDILCAQLNTAAAPPAEAPAESSSKRALKREIARLQTELAKRIAAPAAPAEGDSDAAIVAARLDECLPTVETMCGKNAGYALRDAAAMLRRLSAPRVTGGREECSEPLDAIYADFCAKDNGDVPLERYPQAAVDALARAGWAVVPCALPFAVLGDAASAGVFETGNPKHGWDYLIARTRIGPALQAANGGEG